MGKVWIVTNGWMGNGQVSVIVVAEDGKEARSIARTTLLDEDCKNSPPTQKGAKWVEKLEAREIQLPYLCEID